MFSTGSANEGASMIPLLELPQHGNFAQKAPIGKRIKIDNDSRGCAAREKASRPLDQRGLAGVGIRIAEQSAYVAGGSAANSASASSVVSRRSVTG